MGLENLNWKKATSSQIKEVAFSHEEQVLYVKFVKGPIWRYEPFSFYEFGELMNASSVGSHFHTEIKNIKTATKISNGN